GLTLGVAVEGWRVAGAPRLSSTVVTRSGRASRTTVRARASGRKSGRVVIGVQAARSRAMGIADFGLRIGKMAVRARDDLSSLIRNPQSPIRISISAYAAAC